MDITIPLKRLRPGAEWSCGETYESIIWHDKIQTQPTLEEVEAEWAVYLKERSDTEYQRKRAKEYPTIEELIVALWEEVVENRPEAAVALQAKREAIKQKYPKPER